MYNQERNLFLFSKDLCTCQYIAPDICQKNENLKHDQLRQRLDHEMLRIFIRYLLFSFIVDTSHGFISFTINPTSIQYLRLNLPVISISIKDESVIFLLEL